MRHPGALATLVSGLITLAPLGALQAEPPRGAPAAGEDSPKAKTRVLVALTTDEPGAVGLAQRIAALATVGLAEARGFEPVELERALVPEADGVRKEALRAAHQSLERGAAAFKDLDLETAGSELESGINTLLSYGDTLDAAERKVLEDGIFEYGASTLFEGETELAESIFVGLLLIARDYTPSPERFPSNVISRFSALRRKLADRPTGGITVSTSPPGADVFVDGTFRGSSPLALSGLVDGQHLVTVRRLGSKPFGTLAPVAAGRSASVEADLEEMPNAALIGRLQPGLEDDVPGALELGRGLGVDRLLLLRLEVGAAGLSAAGTWLDVAGRRELGRVPPTRIAADPDAAARSLVEAVPSEPPPKPSLVELPPVITSPTEPPLFERWWFWALVGGAALATGTSVALIASRREDSALPRSTAVLGF